MTSFGPPPTVSAQLRAMKPKTDIVIKTDKPGTVFAIASRLREERREFTCRREDGAVHVWCMK